MTQLRHLFALMRYRLETAVFLFSIQPDQPDFMSRDYRFISVFFSIWRPELLTLV